MQDLRDVDERRADARSGHDKLGLQDAEAPLAYRLDALRDVVSAQRGECRAAVRGRDVNLRVQLDELSKRERALLGRWPRDVLAARLGHEVAEQGPRPDRAEAAEVDEHGGRLV